MVSSTPTNLLSTACVYVHYYIKMFPANIFWKETVYDKSRQAKKKEKCLSLGHITLNDPFLSFV